MKLKKKLVDLHFMALQVLELSPEKKSIYFKKGFSDFLEIFFQDLNNCSAAFPESADTNEADLTIIMELTYGTLKHKSRALSETSLKEYWEGSSLAAEKSLLILELAFETITVNSEAA